MDHYKRPFEEEEYAARAPEVQGGKMEEAGVQMRSIHVCEDTEAAVVPSEMSEESSVNKISQKQLPPTTSPGQTTPHVTGVKLWLIIGSLYVMVFCIAMDKTLLAIALGHITTEFETVRDVGWYVSSYLLTLATTQMLYGSLYRHFNAKWVYISAVAVFEAGNVIAGAAPTSAVLILGRAISGVGAAGISSGGYVVLSKSLPLHKIVLYLGFHGAIWAVATIVGPMVGGAFADHITWRWCFYVNLPIGAVASAVFLYGFEDRSPPPPAGLLTKLRQLDILGETLIMSSIVMLLLALQWGGAELPWSSATIIGLFIGAGLTAVLFALLQVRLQDKGSLPMGLVKNRDVICAWLFSLFSGMSNMAIGPYLPLYVQAILDVSAGGTAVRLLGFYLSSVISAMATNVIISKTRTYNVVLLMLAPLIAVGAGLMSTFSANTTVGQLIGYQIIYGLGAGVSFESGFVVVQNVVAPQLIPQATANVSLFQSLGGAISMAIAQSVFQGGIMADMARNVPSSVPASVVLNTGATEIRKVLRGLGLSATVISRVLEAYMTGLRNVFLLIAVAGAVSCLAAAGLRWKKIEKR